MLARIRTAASARWSQCSHEVVDDRQHRAVEVVLPIHAVAVRGQQRFQRALVLTIKLLFQRCDLRRVGAYAALGGREFDCDVVVFFLDQQILKPLELGRRQLQALEQ